MAERSQFWSTSTTGDGATTITEAQTTEWHRDLHTPRTDSNAPSTSQGVLRGVLNELAVSGASSPVSVATGAAVAAGYYYKNDAAVSVTVPTPAANTRVDRIVLRVSHGATRTVRITRIAGTEGAGGPSLTQSAGTTWDIPLAQVSITTGGVITVTDQRAFAQFATNHVKRDGDTMTGTLNIENSDPTLRFIEDDAPSDNKVWTLAASGQQFGGALLTDALGGAASWLAVDRTGTTVDTVNFPNGKLQALGYAVPHVRRQGGNATNWATAGTTDYAPAAARILTGSAQITVTAGSLTGSVTVTWPSAFAGSPLLLATANDNLSSANAVTVSGLALSTTQGTIQARIGATLGVNATIVVHWIAIGPL